MSRGVSDYLSNAERAALLEALKRGQVYALELSREIGVGVDRLYPAFSLLERCGALESRFDPHPTAGRLPVTPPPGKRPRRQYYLPGTMP